MKREILTPREHLALGAELSDIEHRLVELLEVAQGAYGNAGSGHVERVRKTLQALRFWLENQMYIGLPHEGDPLEGVPATQVYFGWRTGPRSWDPPGLKGPSPRERLSQAAQSVFADGNPWRGYRNPPNRAGAALRQSEEEEINHHG